MLEWKYNNSYNGNSGFFSVPVLGRLRVASGLFVRDTSLGLISSVTLSDVSLAWISSVHDTVSV